jgi:hypothetical protein
MFGKQDKPRYLKIGVSGESGAGKTSIIKTINPDAKILLLNFENGLISIESWLNLNQDRVVVWDFLIDDYEKLIKLIKMKSEIEKFDYVVFDSLTFAYKLIEKFYMKQSKVKNSLEIQHYKQIAQDLEDIINAFRMFDINVVYLMHTADVRDKFNDVAIRLAFSGNLSEANILGSLDFSFLLLKSNTTDTRALFTTNGVVSETNPKVIGICKKRDEFNVLSRIEGANLHQVLTKYKEETNNKINNLK